MYTSKNNLCGANYCIILWLWTVETLAVVSDPNMKIDLGLHLVSPFMFGELGGMMMRFIHWNINAQSGILTHLFFFSSSTRILFMPQIVRRLRKREIRIRMCGTSCMISNYYVLSPESCPFP